MCGWAWLGWPRGLGWFGLRSLEQEKRKEACCDHSHLLPGWEGRVGKDLVITEVRCT